MSKRSHAQSSIPHDDETNPSCSSSTKRPASELGQLEEQPQRVYVPTASLTAALDHYTSSQQVSRTITVDCLHLGDATAQDHRTLLICIHGGLISTSTNFRNYVKGTIGSDEAKVRNSPISNYSVKLEIPNMKGRTMTVKKSGVFYFEEKVDHPFLSLAYENVNTGKTEREPIVRFPGWLAVLGKVYMLPPNVNNPEAVEATGTAAMDAMIADIMRNPFTNDDTEKPLEFTINHRSLIVPADKPDQIDQLMTLWCKGRGDIPGFPEYIVKEYEKRILSMPPRTPTK